MRLISVNMLNTGDVLACNIFSGNGNMLLKNNTEMTDKVIARLKRVGIYSVYVEDEYFNDVKIRFPLTDQSKSAALSEIKEYIDKIKGGRPIRHEAVQKLGYEIYQEVRVAAVEPINVVSTFAPTDVLISHCLNTAIITAAICEKMNVAPGAAANYVTAALLHDAFLGEMEDEFGDNNLHGKQIYAYLKSSSSYDTVCYLPTLLHHEQFDGQGPNRTRGKQIHEGARILAVADLFDNVLSGLAGFASLLPYQAMEYVTAQANTLLDPDVVRAFSNCVAVYPTGSSVVLSTGEDAVVVGQNNGQPARPIVCTTSKSQGRGKEYNLLTEHTIFINLSSI